jgi:hypothetical protein
LNRHANVLASKHLGGEGAARNPQPNAPKNQIVEDVLKVKNPKAPAATRATDGTF